MSQSRAAHTQLHTHTQLHAHTHTHTHTHIHMCRLGPFSCLSVVTKMHRTNLMNLLPSPSYLILKMNCNSSLKNWWYLITSSEIQVKINIFAWQPPSHCCALSKDRGNDNWLIRYVQPVGETSFIPPNTTSVSSAVGVRCVGV